MKIPQYLEPIVSDVERLNDSQLRMNLSIAGNSKFQILTHGVHEVINGMDFIMPKENDNYLKIVICPLDSTEQYIVFDGKIHGYDNLFCDEHTDIERSMTIFEFKGSSIFTGVLTIGYNIDYEEEKEEYDVDESDMVEVFNRNTRIPWLQVKEEGYDYINIIFTNENGDIIEVDFELA